MKILLEKLKMPLTVLGGVIACLLALAIVQKAYAADKGGSLKDTNTNAAVAAASGWTGCGPGIHGGWVQGSTVFSGPIDIGTQGSTFGVTADCLFRIGTGPVVVGMFVDYDRVFGDAHKLGLDSNLTVGGRLGYLVTPSALVYGLAGWSRLAGDFGNSDGYVLGGGVELKLRTDQPWFADFRYEHGRYKDLGGSGFDADSNSVRAGLIYRFGAMPRP